MDERPFIKIAIIGSRGYPYIYSGYETFVKELCERLVAKGFEITVYCHKNLFTAYPQSVNGIRLEYIPSIETKVMSQLPHSFFSIVHACTMDFDVIFVVNSANGPFGLITKLFRQRTIINVDGLEWLRPKWKGLGSLYFYWASKMSTRLYDVIVTDSAEMEKIYKKEFQADSRVIAYGANVRTSKNPQLIKRWNLSENGYCLIVGRLVPDNNAGLLAREFMKSKSKKKLVIVGGVPYADSYVEEIKSLEDDRLVFTGYVTDADELAELYHNCYLYLHGHEFGGTNPTMLQALAYGCAICALDTVFNREMLQDGSYGVFFTKTEFSLASTIEDLELHFEKVKSLREKSRTRIIENYTWEKITDQYAELLYEVSGCENQVSVIQTKE